MAGIQPQHLPSPPQALPAPFVPACAAPEAATATRVGVGEQLQQKYNRMEINLS